MKVSELIELLQFQEPDLEVHFSYGYGDHWRTEVAPAVGSIKEGLWVTATITAWTRYWMTRMSIQTRIMATLARMPSEWY